MPIRNHIEDGLGTGKTAQVTPKNAVLVQVVPETSSGIPPDDLTNIRLQREYFTDSTNSELMNVDGSTTPVEFDVSAELGLTKWITGFRILLEGTNLEMNTNDFRRFGAATASNTPLTNGVEVFSEQGGIVTDISVEPIVIMGDFFSYSDEYLNLINAVSAQSDYLQFVFRFDKPIVLPDGTPDRLVIRINDDLTAIDKFVAIARGYKEAT